MSSNTNDEVGLNADGGVYRTSVSLPRAFLGAEESAAGSRHNVALAVLLSVAAWAIVMVLIALVMTHPADELDLAQNTELAP